MQRLRIRDQMAIEQYICNPAEADTTTETLSREDLLGDS